MLELASTFVAQLGLAGSFAIGAPAVVSGLFLRRHARRTVQRLREVRERLRPIASLTTSGPATVMGCVLSVENQCALVRDQQGGLALVALRARVRVGDQLLVDGVASQLRTQHVTYREDRRIWVIDASGDGALACAPVPRSDLALRATLAVAGGALFASGLAVIAGGLATWLA